ncbi:MAG: hypothetical protein ACYSUD_21830 [Planctomycetota bacterium]|jgi:hypothetical protein
MFRRTKTIPSVCQTSQRCPKTGKLIRRKRKYFWLMWLLPVAGLVSLIWFLVRVIPKPSRATYPCQRFAAPLAGGFVVWLTGLIGSAVAYRKAKQFLRQSRYVIAASCIALGLMSVWLSLSLTAEKPAAAAFVPSEPPNSPIGIAKGIHPGRVAWVRDPSATSWDGSTDGWWDDDNTDQDAVDVMISRTIQTLTGQPTDADSWDALFRHFNSTKGSGDIGYQRGERIAVKINMNQENNSGGNWSSRVGNPSPHVVYLVLRQLIEVVQFTMPPDTSAIPSTTKSGAIPTRNFWLSSSSSKAHWRATDASRRPMTRTTRYTPGPERHICPNALRARNT